MAKKLKIAFVNAYQNKVNRGAERFVVEVAKRLSRSCEVSLLSGNFVFRKRWPLLWRIFVDLSGLSILFFTLGKLPDIWNQKFDVVIPLNGGWQAVLIRLITWFYGGKMVVVGQSGIGWDDRVNLWTHPDVFVGISTKACDWARKINPWVKSTYLPNGVDMNKFKFSGKKFSTELGRPRVLCVGALTSAKRIDLAIGAVAKLKEVGLLVVGNDDEERETLLNSGKDLLGNRFQLMSVGLEQMPAIYRSADIFTLPSLPSHSFEIVLVEAMAMGLPVVANDDPIRREIVGDAGLLVDPTNLDSYAKALKKALDMPRDGRYRRQAEKFDWDEIAKKYEGLFLEL